LGCNADRFLTSADFLRMRFGSFGYDFSPKLLKGTGFSRLRMFGNAENLFTITPWRGFDAETLNASNVTQSRLYPTPRTFSLGFEFGF